MAFYRRFEGWPLIDCLYFTVASLTTVGFGDVVPRHPATRLFLSCHILVELVLFVLAFGRFLNRFVAKESRQRRGRLMLPGARNESESLLARAKSGRRKQFAWKLATLCGWVVLSASIGRFSLQLDSWVDAFYFGVVTLTTMGFGDFVPQTPLAKAAVSLLCLVGVPLFGATLAGLAKLIYEATRDSRMECLDLLTATQLASLQQFCKELEDSGAYSSEREGGTLKISPFEYLCFVLMRSNLVSLKDIAAVTSNFQELDTSGDGYLEVDDVK